MDDKILDLLGVVHEYENGVRHNTKCGYLRQGTRLRADLAFVDCLECIGGPSHTTIEDLLHADDLWILLVGVDDTGVQVTPMSPVRFDRGTNSSRVVWTQLPTGTRIDSVRYCRRDHVVLHSTKLEPSLTPTSVHCTIEIEPGHISLTERV